MATKSEEKEQGQGVRREMRDVAGPLRSQMAPMNFFPKRTRPRTPLHHREFVLSKVNGGG